LKTHCVLFAIMISIIGFGCTDQDNGVTLPESAFETIGEPYLLFAYPADPGDSYMLSNDSIDPDVMQVLSVDSLISVPDGEHYCHSYRQRSSYYIDAPIFNYHLAPTVGFVRQEVIDTAGREYFKMIWELEGLDIPINPPEKRQPAQVIMPLHVGWRWRGVQTSIIRDDTISGNFDFIVAESLMINDEKWYLLSPVDVNEKSAFLKGEYPIYANRADGLWRWNVKFE